MTRQYNTIFSIFYNTVECNTQKYKKIQIHLLRNSNTIEVIKHSISYIISRCTNNKYYDQICTSELRFGFKRNRSTNMCTMVLKETVSYYIKNQSSVLCTFLR